MKQIARRFLISLSTLALLGVLAWFAWSQFGPGTTEGTEQRLRFGNISVLLPESGGDHSALKVFPDYAPPESSDKAGGGPIVVVSYPNTKDYLVIDALTGEVVVDEIGSRDRSEVDAVVGSIRVETEPLAVWPLADVASVGPRVELGEISYIQPDPSSGIFVAPGTSDGPDGGGSFLFVHNGRSRMTVDGNTGEVDQSRVLPADREAFQRFADSVTLESER